MPLFRLFFFLYPIIFFLFACIPYGVFAGAGTEADSKGMGQPCVPGEGPCFVATDEPGASLYRTRWAESDDPAKDGWDTEVFNTEAGRQLKKVGKLLQHPEKINVDTIERLVAEKFHSPGITGRNMGLVFKGNSVTVRRQTAGVSPSAAVPREFKGREGFVRALRELAEPFNGAEELRFKFKLFRVAKEKGMVTTRQYFAISGITRDGVLEQNATWDILWRDEKGQLPRIVSVSVADFEEVSGRSAAGRIYEDVTESVLYHNQSYSSQILRGYPEFLSAMENTLEFNVFGTPGLAVGDVDGDGLDDVYICQEQGLPNLLLRQNSDGTATDISAAAGVNWLESSRSTLFLDLDNDSDQDLVVAMPGAVIVAANDGRGKFSVIDSLPVGDDPMSMAAADYDSDGDIDFYVTLYNPNRPIEKAASTVRSSGTDRFVYHDANNGPENVLFRNELADGSLKFTDATEHSGLDVNNRRFSLAASWEDYDNDGDQDLYVANDYGRDNLYRNDTVPGGEPRFTDVSDTARIEDSAGSMGIAWGDYNRDGFMDGFVSAMWSSAGNRVTFQESFKPDSPVVKERLQQFARGNTMLKNNGDATFSDVSAATGVEMGRWAWSSNFVDMNSDGWEDMVVTNGFLTGDAEGGDL